MSTRFCFSVRIVFIICWNILVFVFVSDGFIVYKSIRRFLYVGSFESVNGDSVLFVIFFDYEIFVWSL